MEKTQTEVKNEILTMMDSQLQMLEVDFDEALKNLGKSSRNKHKTQDEYAIYFERVDKCNICEAKLNMMYTIIEQIKNMPISKSHELIPANI